MVKTTTHFQVTFKLFQVGYKASGFTGFTQRVINSVVLDFTIRLIHRFGGES